MGAHDRRADRKDDKTRHLVLHGNAECYSPSSSRPITRPRLASIDPCPSPHPCLQSPVPTAWASKPVQIQPEPTTTATPTSTCSEHRAPGSLPGNLNCLTPTGCAPLQSLTCELAFGCDVTAPRRNEGQRPKTQNLRLAAPQQTTAHARTPTTGGPHSTAYPRHDKLERGGTGHIPT